MGQLDDHGVMEALRIVIQLHNNDVSTQASKVEAVAIELDRDDLTAYVNEIKTGRLLKANGVPVAWIVDGRVESPIRLVPNSNRPIPRTRDQELAILVQTPDMIRVPTKSHNDLFRLLAVKDDNVLVDQATNDEEVIARHAIDSIRTLGDDATRRLLDTVEVVAVEEQTSDITGDHTNR